MGGKKVAEYSLKCMYLIISHMADDNEMNETFSVIHLTESEINLIET